MAKGIVKCGDDLYMEWSTVVEAPTFVGTREEMAEYLQGPSITRGLTRDYAGPAEVTLRLDRVDRQGHSFVARHVDVHRPDLHAARLVAPGTVRAVRPAIHRRRGRGR